MALPVSAQDRGRIDLSVVDNTGAVLPGAGVEITGPENRSAIVTGLEGDAHLLRLPVGTYVVRVTLSGFRAYEDTAVLVRAASSTQVMATLSVGGVTETLTVSGASPVIDPLRQSTDTHVTLDELQGVPSARDPWVILQSIPSVIVDRVNVGGAESGQQSQFMAKGADGNENTWTLDGVTLTDMSSMSSPGYWDFDMFSEMRVNTGGADIQNQTPGVAVDLVLKSGTNAYHGSMRGYFANESLQKNNLSDELATSIGGDTEKGNRMDQYADYGFEIGGPILEDRIWGWASWGETDIRLRTLIDTIDRTTLTNRAVKIQGQVANGFRVGFTHFNSAKTKLGRDTSPTRPDETTFNQSGTGKGLFSGSGDWVIGNDLVLSAKGSYYNSGFQLDPRGGLDGPGVIQDLAGVYGNSFLFYGSDRPQRSVTADANYFRGNHELKVGFGWRKIGVESQLEWPGGQLSIHLADTPDGLLMLPIFFQADNLSTTDGRYWSMYAGDTISMDRFTLDVGLRFDRAAASLSEDSRRAHPVIPDIFPALTTPAQDNTHVFNIVTPRVGVSYALGEEADTLVRASYGQFASQLSTSDAQFVAGPLYYSYVYYYALDANGDGLAQVDELSPYGYGILGSYGFDPTNPTSTDSVNRIGSDLGSPRTHELIFGVDRELPIPNTAITASVTYRRFNSMRWRPMIGVRQADFFVASTLNATLPDEAGGASVSQDVYEPLPGVLPVGNGREEENREGYHQRYWGWEVNFIKRMSNRWMARAGFSYNGHREYFTNPATAIEDPTPLGKSAKTSLGGTNAGPLQDGGLVVTRSSGSGKSEIYFVSPQYQFVANGIYQAPYGINIAANLLIRQGLGQPYHERVNTSDPASPQKFVLLAPDAGDHRLSAVRNLDLRIGKELRFDQVTMNIDLDWFNVFNASTVLRRQYDNRFPSDSPTGVGNTLEILNPSIVRFGFRLLLGEQDRRPEPSHHRWRVDAGVGYTPNLEAPRCGGASGFFFCPITQRTHAQSIRCRDTGPAPDRLCLRGVGPALAGPGQNGRHRDGCRWRADRGRWMPMARRSRASS